VTACEPEGWIVNDEGEAVTPVESPAMEILTEPVNPF
jgi:hypothetical protein